MTYIYIYIHIYCRYTYHIGPRVPGDLYTGQDPRPRIDRQGLLLLLLILLI